MDSTTLTDILSQRLNCDRKDVDLMLKALNQTIELRCGEMDSIALPAFGCFEPKMRKERIVVMPGTGKRMLVPPKVTLTFKPSAILKQRLREE